MNEQACESEEEFRIIFIAHNESRLSRTPARGGQLIYVRVRLKVLIQTIKISEFFFRSKVRVSASLVVACSLS